MILAHPLTSEAFSPFGDVIALGQGETRTINQGLCRRHHDLAEMDFSDGRAAISLFQAALRTLPCSIDLIERHPEGSQAFLPMQDSEYLVVVAPDDAGRPGQPVAFYAKGDQGVNYHRNVWHAVLTPVAGSGLFAVVDRIGSGANLEEHWFDRSITVDIKRN